MVKVNLAERDPAHGNSNQCLAKLAIEVDAHHLLQPWLLVGVKPFCTLGYLFPNAVYGVEKEQI